VGACALVVSSLVACGDDAATTTAPVDGGASDGASSVPVEAAAPPTELSACKTYLQAYCDRLVECGAAPTSACDLYEPLCPDYTFATGSTRTIEGVLACADVRRKQPCSELLGGFTPDCSPPGTLDAGAPCRFGAQCASDTCSSSPGQCGQCAALATDTEPCRQGCGTTGPCVACEINATCNGGQCAPLVAASALDAGSSCSSSVKYQFCPPPLRCLGTTGQLGVCKVLPAIGEACTYDLVQPTKSPCATGRCARQTNGTFLCTDGLAKEGESCDATRTSDECEMPLVCIGSTDAKCVAPKADGAGCNSPDACGRTSFCSTNGSSSVGTCMPRIALGAPCRAGLDVCAASATCTASVTADGGLGPTVCIGKPTAAIGEPCTTKSDCARSADCNEAHVCAFTACQ